MGAAVLGAPLVGFLSERVFGYIKLSHGLNVTGLTTDRLSNARALSLSMLCMTVGPWMANFVVYCILHKTYKKDKRNGSIGESDAMHRATSTIVPVLAFCRVVLDLGY